MTDLVVVSLEPWDGVWRRNQHLVAGLLRAGHVERVLFVEPPQDPVHALSRRRRPRGGHGLRVVSDLEGVARGRLMTVQPTKWLPRRVDPQADARMARSMERAARRAGLRRPVLWINDPGGAELLRRTGWPSLYDITDDWLLADRPDAELARVREQEEFLFQRCEEVVVCSPALERSRSQQRQVTLIPNAVDLDGYRELAPRPEDLPDGRIALYLGTAHRDRLDVELCVATAHAIDGTLVLVGPAPLTSDDVRMLNEAGVLLLGPRPSRTVPAYLQHADVLVVPHVVTPFTESLDPIKAYEYRAAGRPVVSTPVPGFSSSNSPLVTTVKNPEDFVTAVSTLLKQDRVASIEDVQVPDWGQRVREMGAVVEQVAAKPAPGLRLAFTYVTPWAHEFRDYRRGLVPSHRLFYAAEMSDLGARVEHYSRPLPRGPLALLRWRLGQAIWASSFDYVVATHEAAAYVTLALRKAKLSHTPILVMTVAVEAATAGTSLPSRLRRWLIASASVVTTFSSAQGEHLRQVAPRARVEFLPLGVDTRFFAPTSSPRSDFVLAVGTNPGKDYPTLIEALDGEQRCVIVTDPANRQQAAVGVGNKAVQFLSDVPIRELRELYLRAKVMVLPLREARMSSGQTVLLESLACGTPVIVSDVACIQDYAEAGGAMTVPPGNAKALRVLLQGRLTRPNRGFDFTSRATADRLMQILLMPPS